MRYTANFERLDGMATLVLPAQQVPTKVWSALREMQQDLVDQQMAEVLPPESRRHYIESQLEQRATNDIHRLREYADIRTNPNAYRGTRGFRSNQLFHDARVALVFDHSLSDTEPAIAGGATLVRNTSPSGGRTGIVARAEQAAKMFSKPGVPIFGGRRYDKITGVHFADEPATALAGLHVALRTRHPADHVSMWHTPGDLHDVEMGYVAEALGLQLADTEPAFDMPELRTGRYVGQIGRVVTHLVNVHVGAQEALDQMTRLTELPHSWQD